MAERGQLRGCECDVRCAGVAGTLDKLCVCCSGVIYADTLRATVQILPCNSGFCAHDADCAHADCTHSQHDTDSAVQGSPRPSSGPKPPALTL